MKMITAGLLAFATLAGTGCKDYSASMGPSYGASHLSSGSAAAAAGAVRSGFGFNGTVSGASNGEVFLTGGGSFDAATASNVIPDTTTDVSSGGGFRCTSAVTTGPLGGCGTDEGVRWDTEQLLATTRFKCTTTDTAKVAATKAGTVALLADFYRAGNGINESFTARIIVSDTDLAPDVPGRQTLWVQGVGCGDAVVNFNR
jgi:hypothetical protein